MDGAFWLFFSFFFAVPAVVILSFPGISLVWTLCFFDVLVQVHSLEVATLELALYRCIGWGFVGLLFVDSGGS